LRRRLVTAGLKRASAHTDAAEEARLIRFLTSGGDQT
jgi:hypothetical protein